MEKENITTPIPLMIFPDNYLASVGIHADRKYAVWILKSSYGHDYIRHMDRRFRTHTGKP
jgi:hypothetical protein